MLFFSFILLGIFPRKVLFFPDNIPNQDIVYIEYPQGTDIAKTNTATLFVEKQVIEVLKKYVDKNTNENFLAESIVSQVGMGAGNPNVDAGQPIETPYKGKVTVNFVEFKLRRGIDTNEILEEIRAKVKELLVQKSLSKKMLMDHHLVIQLVLQLTGTNYDEMLDEADKVIAFINSKNITGIEKLNIDVNKETPELEVKSTE